MKKLGLEVKLSVVLLKEGNKYIAHSPALDLSTFGKSYREAKKRFSEIVQIFFEELADADNLESVLYDLGWQRRNARWQPPVFVSQELQTVKLPA